MKKAIEKVRKICMVASGTLGIFSCMHVSFAPISAALGLTYNEICELGFNFVDLEKEFQNNVEETLDNLKKLFFIQRAKLCENFLNSLLNSYGLLWKIYQNLFMLQVN